MTPQIKITNASFTVGPRDWPYILLTLMLILGTFGLVKSFIKARKPKETESAVNHVNKEPERTLFKLSIPVLALLSIIIFVILLEFIGFILSSILFLYGLSLLLGAKKQLNSIIFAIITTAVFVALFSILLQIPLPRGVGIFRQFSLLFY